jgi:hypothetical protein
MGIIANSYESAFMTPGTDFPGSSYVPGEQPVMSINTGFDALDLGRYNSPSVRRNLLGRYSKPDPVESDPPSGSRRWRRATRR